VALLLCHCFRFAITNQRPNDDTAVAMQGSYDAYLHTECLIAHGLKSFGALQRKIRSLGMSLQVNGRVVRDVSKDRNGFNRQEDNIHCHILDVQHLFRPHQHFFRPIYSIFFLLDLYVKVTL